MTVKERYLEAWARFILNHRVAVSLGILIITALLGWSTTQLPVITTLRDFLPPDAVGMIEWEAARERFGGDELTVIVLKDENHFTPEGIARLKALNDRFTEHPYVEQVVSIVTSQKIGASPDDPDTLLVTEYLSEGRSPAEIKAAILAEDKLRKTLVSEDGLSTLFIVRAVPNNKITATLPHIWQETNERTRDLPNREAQLRDPQGERRLLEMAKQNLGYELEAIALKSGYAQENVHITGFSMIISAMLASAENNMKTLFPLSALLLAITLLLLFRRFVDTILPLLCIGPAIIWAVGIGGLLFGRITLMTSIAPVMVLVVGVSDVVHLVTQFRHEISRGNPRDEAILIAFRQVGTACLLTSVTTFLGFASLIFLPLPGLRELGFFAGIGVITAFLLAFLITPILLSLTNPRPNSNEGAANDVLTPLLHSLAVFLKPRSKQVLGLGILLTLATLAATSQVTVENDLVQKFKASHPIQVAVKVIEKKFGGHGEVELLIDTGTPNGMKSPEVLSALSRLDRWLEQQPNVNQTNSLVDLLRELHTVLAPNQSPKHDLPMSRSLVAQYLLLFEASGGENTETLVDETGQYARMSIHSPHMSAETFIVLADQIDAKAREFLPPSVSALSNGFSLQAARVAPAMLAQSFPALSSTIVLIAILLGFLFRSINIGLLSIIPNILPVGVALFSVWLVYGLIDVDSLTFLTVCICIAVDDTIHFLTRYRIERDRGLERDQAVETTIVEAGLGIIRTSIILSLGFSVMVTADYTGTSLVGVMLPVTMIFAVILDLTVLPAMASLGLFDQRA